MSDEDASKSDADTSREYF